TSRYLARAAFRYHCGLFTRRIPDDQTTVRAFLREYYNVVDDAPVSGSDLSSLNPAIFGEIRWHREVLVLHNATRWNGVLLWHVEHYIRLWDIPSVKEVRFLRQIFRIAFTSALIDPSDNRVYVFLREPPVIRKLLVTR